ncbi:MAG: ABC transporter ATP-binding protein [Firmicutes bacterium]|nr:ABC transporter ATP-binding protein [Bacillota bacterium]
MDSVIACRDLRKDYGRKRVLTGVDLEVPSGSVFALLGTNGAGKTTLIRIVLGLLPKSGGEIRVLGEEPYRFGPDLRQRIGYVSEEQGLYPWMTVRGIIGFCRSLYDRWDEEFVQRYLERFGLDRRARVRSLSHGQRVKLALILALAPRPGLLVLDEPMSGLDPLAQYEFLQVVVREISREGRTIFFSTHILADVEAVAERVAILHGGRIQACGTLAEVRGAVRKLRVRSEGGPSPSLGHVLAWEERGGIVLASAAGLSEVAATAEILGEEPASLEEAFVYFCARGRA